GASMTVSLYVGDIDLPNNGRRKRDVDDQGRCMLLDEVTKSVSQTLSKLSEQSSVKRVRFITYAGDATISDEMDLDVGQTFLKNVQMKKDGADPKQSSSMKMFADKKRPNEELVHYMPCNTTYNGHEEDFKESGSVMNTLNKEKDSKVTIVSRTMDADQIIDNFNLDDQSAEQVHIVDKHEDPENIADVVSDIIEDDTRTTVAGQTFPPKTTTTRRPKTKPTESPPVTTGEPTTEKHTLAGTTEG
ncbi:hypothetical protein PFISCL1PPCAC_25355, partial [Pristionchus fissidentatus]